MKCDNFGRSGWPNAGMKVCSACKEFTACLARCRPKIVHVMHIDIVYDRKYQEEGEEVVNKIEKYLDKLQKGDKYIHTEISKESDESCYEE